MSDSDWPEWWINPVMAVDAEGIEHPFVPLRMIANCEHYSPDSGALMCRELTTHKLSDSDIEKLTAWRGRQVAIHDTHRRSFGYYELEMIDDGGDHVQIVLCRGLDGTVDD